MESYQPISLLNIDYKLLASIRADRFYLVMEDIVHSYQIGFIRGRCLRHNVKKVVNVTDKATRLKQEIILFFAYAEKALDRIEWPFMKLVVQKIGLSNKLRTWIEVIYNEPTAILLINGECTEEIKLSRGVQQGCPMSPLLFNLGIEMLAMAVRQSEQLKGLKVVECEYKLAQYVDNIVGFFYYSNRIYETSKYNFTGLQCNIRV